ncbi:MAG: Ig-like domain-containing protein [Candidatus Shapirobacteria bacterium]|jgi:hypothetical protein
MKTEKHIPTILGLLFLLGAVFGGVILTKQNSNSITKASGNCEPINPQITNITYNSANISFTTSSDCLTNINLDNKTFLDIKPKSKIHYFEINSLKENDEYSFTIISDGKNFSSDSFNFQTAKKPQKNIPSSNLAWGKTLTPEKKPATDAIVYLNIPGGSPLSALVTSSGNWNISLSTSFNESLTDWFTPASNIEESIVVISSGYNQTQIISNTSRNNPVPDIILGQNNFSLPENIENSNNESLITTNNDLSVNKTLTISNPKDNESISSKKPAFFGTASPNSNLSVKVESPIVITDKIQVNNDGSWNWSPPQDLTPGEHTITITTEKDEIISRKFIVLAAEKEPSFSASSSAIITTPTPTITPTIIVTSTPTATNTPTKIKSSNPSTSSGVPKTGTSLPTLLLIFFSISSVTFAYVYNKKS